MPGRRASASTFSTASARPSCCTSFCRTRPATSNTAPRAVRCRATRCGWSTTPATTCPTARSANCWSMRPPPARATGTSAARAAQTFEGHWTRTGDKYIRDADGRYTFCGRADDMFKVSGIWVSPFEVESALITHPAVLEAAVVPEADPEGLLKPKAFVVLRAGRQRRRPARGAEGARQAEDRPVEISALDRGGATACRRPRPGRSSGSSCGMGLANDVVIGRAGARTPRPRAETTPDHPRLMPRAKADLHAPGRARA